jgi:anti-sigma factor RsiW
VVEEHLSTEQIERYRQKSLAAAELLTVDAHIADCAACRKSVAEAVVDSTGIERLRDGLHSDSARPAAHLTYAQLAGCVDGGLDAVEREIVESHIAVCTECKSDWLDLEAFRKSLAAELPGTPAIHAELPWRERLAAFFSPWIGKTPLRAIAALAVIALLVWVGSRLVREMRESRLESARSGEQRPGQVGKPQVQPGTGPSQGESEIAALNDGGGRISLRRDGSVAGLPEVSEHQRDAVALVLAGRPLPLPVDIADLAAPPGTLLGDVRPGVPIELTSPVGTAVIADRPTFRWQPLPGARQYEVSVYDDGYTRIAISPSIVVTEWTPARGFESGRVYSWQVKAFRGGEEVLSPKPPAPEAKFRVLDRKQAGDLMRAQQEQAGSHLVLGILFAASGALDDAERELSALAAANPQSAIPERLLRELAAARSR